MELRRASDLLELPRRGLRAREVAGGVVEVRGATGPVLLAVDAVGGPRPVCVRLLRELVPQWVPLRRLAAVASLMPTLGACCALAGVEPATLRAVARAALRSAEVLYTGGAYWAATMLAEMGHPAELLASAVDAVAEALLTGESSLGSATLVRAALDDKLALVAVPRGAGGAVVMTPAPGFSAVLSAALGLPPWECQSWLDVVSVEGARELLLSAAESAKSPDVRAKLAALAAMVSGRR